MAVAPHLRPRNRGFVQGQALVRGLEVARRDVKLRQQRRTPPIDVGSRDVRGAHDVAHPVRRRRPRPDRDRHGFPGRPLRAGLGAGPAGL